MRQRAWYGWLALWCGIAVLATTTFVGAADYFVNDDLYDAQDQFTTTPGFDIWPPYLLPPGWGTAVDKPFRSPNCAAFWYAMGSGDSIYLDAGKYPGFRLTADDGGVIIRCAGPSKTTIDGQFALYNCPAVTPVVTFYQCGGGLVGATVTGGNGRVDGAGISLIESDAVISYCVVKENRSATQGGGIAMSGGTPIIAESSVKDNSSVLGGGIYYGNGATPTITRCSISGNDAISGGGVYCGENCSGTLMESVINGNYAHDGGGVYVASGSTATITRNCEFHQPVGADPVPTEDIYGEIKGNTAYNGGGIFCAAGSRANITLNRIHEHINSAYGGAIFVDTGATATIQDNVVWGPLRPYELIGFINNNSVSESGGGVFVQAGGTATMICNDVSGNSAVKNGGAVAAKRDAVINMDGNAFGSNTAGQDGGGAWFFGCNPLIGSDQTNIYDERYLLFPWGPSIAGETDDGDIYSSNSATNLGGALYFSQAGGDVNSLQVFGNRAASGGGAAFADACTTEIHTSVFDSNQATNGGNFYCTSGADIAVDHSLVASGQATNDGGGFYLHGTKPTLVNVTVPYNTANSDSDANGDGGGIFCHEGASPNVRNTIFWGNAPEQVAFAATDAPSSITASYCDFQGGEAAVAKHNNGETHWLSGNWAEDPQFVDYYFLASQGGHWNVTFSVWVYDQLTSPGVDNGDPNDPYGLAIIDGLLTPLTSRVASWVQLTGERWPNGWRINMGMNGSTWMASRCYRPLKLLAAAEPLVIPEGSYAKLTVNLEDPPIDYFAVTMDLDNSADADPDISAPFVRDASWTTEADYNGDGLDDWYCSDYDSYQDIVIVAREDADAKVGHRLLTASLQSGVNPYTPKVIDLVEGEDDIQLTVVAHPGGTTTPTGAILVDTRDDMPYRVEAKANVDYIFDHWEDTPDVLSEADHYQPATAFTSTTDVRLEAFFLPTLSVGDMSVGEAEGTATVSVVLSGESTSRVTVKYDTADGTALGGEDFQATSGRLEWELVGGTTVRGPKRFSIVILDDLVDEANESIIVTLGEASGAAISKGAGEVTIVDDDPTSVLSLSDLSVAEGNKFTLGGVEYVGALVTVQAANATALTRTFDYKTRAGGSNPATGGMDYIATMGTVTMRPDDASASFPVLFLDDNIQEGDETLVTVIFNPKNCYLTGYEDPAYYADTDPFLPELTAVLTITDDDQPTFSVRDMSVDENVSGGVAVVPVKMEGTSIYSARVDYYTTVDYNPSEVTATVGIDFVTKAGTLNWAAGETGEKTFYLTIVDDTLSEPNEVLWVGLTNPVANPGVSPKPARIKDGAGIATIEIRDNDPATVSLTVVDVAESDEVAWITVNLSGPTGFQNVSVDCLFTEGTATYGKTEDYYFADATDSRVPAGVTPNPTARLVTFSWSKGEYGDKKFPLLIVSDAIYEVAGTVKLNLQSALNADIAQGNAVLTITDDDLAPQIRIMDAAPVAYQPKDGKTGVAKVLVGLTTGTEVTDITVFYETMAALPPNKAAVVNDDYLDVSGTLTWPKKSTETKEISIPLLDDNAADASEYFRVRLSKPTPDTGPDAVTFASGVDTAVVRIMDAHRPEVAVADQTCSEGVGVAAFQVVMTGYSDNNVSVRIASAAGTATPTADYVQPFPEPGQLIWVAGTTGALPYPVTITDDVEPEPDETIRFSLTSATYASIKTAQATLTIRDNEAPTLFIKDSSVTESTGVAVITVSLSTACTTGAVSVDYATRAGTAEVTSDYLSTSGTLNWAMGEAGNMTFNVTIVDDNVGENDETVYLDLTNPVNANFPPATLSGTLTATLTIKDDASDIPQLTVSSAAWAENNALTSGSGFVFSVTKTGINQLGRDVSCKVVSKDGTALAGTDYVAVDSTLSWGYAETGAKTVTVQFINDELDEDDETFTLTVTDIVNALSTTPTATITIIDDDPLPVISIEDVSAHEEAEEADLTVKISGKSGHTVTVDYASGDPLDTATPIDALHPTGGDYYPVSGTLTWAVGTNADQTISVVIFNDAETEATEVFRVALANAVHAAVSRTKGSGAVSIIDDETPTVQMVAATATGNEGDGVVNVWAKLDFTRKTSVDVIVRFATHALLPAEVPVATIAATPGVDYVARTDELRFKKDDIEKAYNLGKRVVQQAIAITLLDEAAGKEVATGTRAFGLDLFSPTSCQVGDSKATVVSIEDDDLPTLAVQDATVGEGDGSVAIQVVMTGKGSKDATTKYATVDDTATAGADYVAVVIDDPTTPNTLTWAAGTTGAKSFSVTIIDDADLEAAETFVAIIYDAANATIPSRKDTATVTIVDNEKPRLSVVDVTVAEDAGTVSVSVHLEGMVPPVPPDGTITVKAATGSAARGSATAGTDYVAASATLTWRAGETGDRVLPITLIDDHVLEGDELIKVTLSNPVGFVEIKTGEGYVTIEDDEQYTVGYASSSRDAIVGDGASATVERKGFLIFGVDAAGDLVPVHLIEYGTVDGGKWLTLRSNDELTATFSVVESRGQAVFMDGVPTHAFMAVGATSSTLIATGKNVTLARTLTGAVAGQDGETLTTGTITLRFDQKNTQAANDPKNVLGPDGLKDQLIDALWMEGYPLP